MTQVTLDQSTSISRPQKYTSSLSALCTIPVPISCSGFSARSDLDPFPGLGLRNGLIERRNDCRYISVLDANVHYSERLTCSNRRSGKGGIWPFTLLLPSCRARALSCLEGLGRSSGKGEDEGLWTAWAWDRKGMCEGSSVVILVGEAGCRCAELCILRDNGVNGNKGCFLWGERNKQL